MSAHFPAPVLGLLAASLLMFGLGFGITTSVAAKRRFFCLPALVQKGYVALYMAPLVAIPLAPQARFGGPAAASRVAGALLLACALGFWLSALHAMRGVPSVRQTKGLVTSGVYGLVRNPLYTANSLVLPGLGLLTHSLSSLALTPVVLALFFAQSLLEERELSAGYGEDYAAYRRRVRHRLIPFIA